MPLTKKTIGFIGAGNMAEALVSGLVTSGLVSPGQITASDSRPERLVRLAETYEIKVFNRNYEVAKGSDIVFLSVKPQDLAAVLGDIAREITPDKLLISIAAGKTTDAIQAGLRLGGLAHPASLIRAMPNTPALVGEGAIGVYRSASVGDSDFDIASTLLSAIGEVFVFTDETLLDAVTGLTGSGPAYFFLFMEALVEAGEAHGIPPAEARAMVLKTTIGAARLARESGKEFPELIGMVASPGGTTVEGLGELEKAGLKKTVARAVEAAVRRARELSSGPA